MIQFNLLPDVKLEYIKTERTKRMVIGFSLLASAVSLAIFVFLVLTVDVAQKAYISGLTNEIKEKGTTLQQTPNLSKMLTVQNQLRQLTGLHEAKPASSRMFDYLSQLTPTNVSIAQMSLDLTAKTVVITGEATNIEAVNAFVDGLKFTTYKTSDGTQESKSAFDSVVLTSLSRSDKSATYTVNMNVDTTIFDNKQDVKLTVSNTAAAKAASVIFKR
ncbi:MAG: PilN domain-containing protein [Candidatus Saccharimonadales bacterium]